MPGPAELIIIFGCLILLFGAAKLPKLGGAVGESIRNFKKGIKNESDDKLEQSDDDETGKDT